MLTHFITQFIEEVEMKHSTEKVKMLKLKNQTAMCA